jgi:hypothetical protein
MTIWGTSAAFRNGLTGNEEWERIDGIVAGLNGGFHHQARRTYHQGVPSNISQTYAVDDIGRCVSAFSFGTGDNNTGWNKMINGDYDATLRSFVNSVPSGHQMYLIYNHEPENDGGSPTTLWRQAWARFAKVVLDCGNSKVVPAFCLMAYTWQTASRNPWDYNPARHMTAEEAAACIGTVDGYGLDAPLTRDADFLFTEPRQDILGWGFRGFGVMEFGVDNVAGRGDWMLDVESWVGAHSNVEIMCWWHSQVQGQPSTFLDDDSNDPTSLQTWADIIAGNQDSTVPVSSTPVTGLPPSSGTGNSTGTPVVSSGNTGGYAITAGGWASAFRVSESFVTGGDPATDDWSFSPVVCAQSDGTALVVYADFPYTDPTYSQYPTLRAARVSVDGTVSARADIYVSAYDDITANMGTQFGFPMGANIVYMWSENSSQTLWFLVSPDLNLLSSATITSPNMTSSDYHVTKIDDTTLILSNTDGNGSAYKISVSESSITATTLTSDLQGVFGSSDPVVLYYASNGVGLAHSYLTSQSPEQMTVWKWIWSGTSVSDDGGGPYILRDDALNLDFDAFTEIWSADDGYLYILPSGYQNGATFIPSTTTQHLYRVDLSGTPAITDILDLHAVSSNPPYGQPFTAQGWLFEGFVDEVVWVGGADASLHSTNLTTLVDTATETVDPVFGSGSPVSLRADQDITGGVWVVYCNSVNSADVASAIEARYWSALTLPDLAGELTERRRKFARPPTDYTP